MLSNYLVNKYGIELLLLLLLLLLLFIVINFISVDDLKNFFNVIAPKCKYEASCGYKSVIQLRLTLAPRV
jgi:hypothetical protein